jgi:uncharacterized Zn finger protein (UPF0148 family)
MECPKCKHPMIEQSFLYMCLNCDNIVQKEEKDWDI